MRKIRAISEDEMIAVYLQTEFHSSRFHQDIAAHMQREGCDPHMLQAPDWQNAQENALRRRLLGAYRGYGRNQGYFIGFPTNMRWERATLTRQELSRSGTLRMITGLNSQVALAWRSMGPGMLVQER